MLVRELLTRGAAIISRGMAAETAWLDATVLWAACCGQKREQILATLGEVVQVESIVSNSGPKSQGAIDCKLPLTERFLAACDRRASGYPIAYLLGRKEFFGRDFMVDESVLIPRPETELLVEWVLESLNDGLFRSKPGSLASPHLVDCCTGSGCIPITLGLEFRRHVGRSESFADWRLTGTDLSPLAIATAIKNQQILAPDVAITWQQADLLSDFAPASVDLLIANPPYVPQAEATGEIPQAWGEPLMALDGGPDGLEVIRRLTVQAASVLRPGGWFFMEYGDGQSATIVDILEAYGFELPEIRRDLAGLPRMVRVRQSGA